jgi:hypothetical protein
MPGISGEGKALGVGLEDLAAQAFGAAQIRTHPRGPSAGRGAAVAVAERQAQGVANVPLQTVAGRGRHHWNLLTHLSAGN